MTFERFMIFAFRRGQAAGGADDFLVTATVETGPALLPGLALLLAREGLKPADVDTVHLVETGNGSPRVLRPLVLIEVILGPHPEGAGFDPDLMRVTHLGPARPDSSLAIP